MNNNQGTALITGASAGIGAEFARRLAKQGYNLILTARREEKLTELATELSEQYNIRCDVIAADLAIESDTERVAETIRNTKDISLLVNNAGFGLSDKLHESNISRQVDMLNVHMVAAMKLTYAALQNMVANKNGDIINVSSVAGFLSGSGSINYCATKAFLINFSKGLQLEVKEYKIRVQALCPGFTITEFHDTEELTGLFSSSRCLSGARAFLPCRKFPAGSFCWPGSSDLSTAGNLPPEIPESG